MSDSAPGPGDTTPDDYATFEHIVPKMHGGWFTRENIVLAHFRCNFERGNVYSLRALRRTDEPDWNQKKRTVL